MELPQKIQDEIWEYCRLNKLTDIDGFITKMVKQGFTVEKYGATPSERIVEKEVEKIIEVEKIVEKEVEVIKEVIVEQIVEKIVEVEVEKEVIREVKVTDDEEINKVLAELESVKNNERIHKKSVYSLAKEKKVVSDENIRLNDLVEEMTTTIQSQRQSSVKVDNLLVDRNGEVTTLNTKVLELESELAVEKAKPKQEIKKDIYGEGKKGYFGSNTRDNG